MEESRVLLYEEDREECQIPVPFTLIPYHRWNSQGICQMSVWLPLFD